MRHHPTDTKIDRISDSWLGTDRSTATWVASVADRIDVDAGSRLEAGRYSYLLLDPVGPVHVVTPRTASAVVPTGTELLAIPTALLGELERRSPVFGPVHAASSVRAAA